MSSLVRYSVLLKRILTPWTTVEIQRRGGLILPNIALESPAGKLQFSRSRVRSFPVTELRPHVAFQHRNRLTQGNILKFACGRRVTTP